MVGRFLRKMFILVVSVKYKPPQLHDVIIPLKDQDFNSTECDIMLHFLLLVPLICIIFTLCLCQSDCKVVSYFPMVATMSGDSNLSLLF